MIDIKAVLAIVGVTGVVLFCYVFEMLYTILINKINMISNDIDNYYIT